LQAVMC